MRTLIIGDSQAAGAPGQALEAGLRRAGDEVKRVGYSGQGPRTWRRTRWHEYQALLRVFRPDRVVLVFGSNDRASSKLEAALVAFRDSARQVFYAGPPRYAEASAERQDIGDRIRAMVLRVFGPKHLDAYPSTGPDVGRAPGGTHFTRAGGATWAAAIQRQLPKPSVGWLVGLAVVAGAGWILWRVGR